MRRSKPSPFTPLDGRPQTKRERTREQVIRMARACIAEKGIANASASEIARRCDLSWGVIQYHFGDRIGLFLAILINAMDNLTPALAKLQASNDDIAASVHKLVNGTWSLLRSEDYPVMLEIQLQLARADAHRDRVRDVTEQMRTALQESWRKALPSLPSERVDRAQRLATTALRGLALEHVLEGERPEHADNLKELSRDIIAFLKHD